MAPDQSHNSKILLSRGIKKAFGRFRRLTLRRKLIVILMFLLFVGMGIFVTRQILRADVLGYINNQTTLTYTNTSGQTENVASNVNQITLTGDATAPTVSITAPTNGTTVSGTITITANANDNVGVTKVDFYRDGTTLLGSDTTSPFSISWNTTTVSNGSHTLVAKAYDAAGNVGTSPAISVTVNNAPSDSIVPEVNITSPPNGATILIKNNQLAISASARDNVGVSKVEFYVNSVLKATDTTSPYSMTWNTKKVSAGTYIITAKAYDAAGNVGQESISVKLVK